MCGFLGGSGLRLGEGALERGGVGGVISEICSLVLGGLRCCRDLMCVPYSPAYSTREPLAAAGQSA